MALQLAYLLEKGVTFWSPGTRTLWAAV